MSVQFLYVFHYAEGSSSCIDYYYTVDINFFLSKIITLVLAVTLAVCIKKKGKSSGFNYKMLGKK